jgi:hypothetical protein
MIEGTFTITFEPPFWVGIVERHDERGYAVARIIYGAEPDNEMIISSIREGYRNLKFTEPTPEPPQMQKTLNYKRQQRELHHLLEKEQGIQPEVADALKAERERQIVERKHKEKAEKEAEEERKYQLRQERHKDKKKGH